jgi:hypothetical protein
VKLIADNPILLINQGLEIILIIGRKFDFCILLLRKTICIDI